MKGGSENGDITDYLHGAWVYGGAAYHMEEQHDHRVQAGFGIHATSDPGDDPGMGVDTVVAHRIAQRQEMKEAAVL